MFRKFLLLLFPQLITADFTSCISKIIKSNAKGPIISVFNASESFTVEVPYIAVSPEGIFFLENIPGKTDMLLLNVDNTEAINSTLNDLFSLRVFDARMKVIVLVNDKEEVEIIGNLLWSYHLYNVLLVVRVDEDARFYKLNFINCGVTVTVQEIGACENIKTEKVFSDLMHKNFENCKLVVIWAYCTPWVMDPHKDDPPGLLVMFFKELAESLRISLEFIPRDEKYRAELQESYSFTGVLNDFNSGYGDIYLSLQTNNEFLYENFYTTFTLIDESVTWIVPRTGRISSWKLLTIIYSKEQWLALFLVVLVMIVLCRIFGKNSDDPHFSSLPQCCLYVFSLLLGVSSHFQPRHARFRFLLATFLFFSFMGTLFVQARMFSLLTQPQYGHQIENLDDLLDSNMPIIFETAMGILFLFYGPKFQRVFDTFIPTNETLDNNIITFLKKKNYATVANKGIFISHPQLRKHVNIFDVIYFQSGALVRKHHVLFESINTRLKSMIEAGLVVKFTDDLKHTFNLNCYKNAGECYFDEDGFGALKMSDLQPALNLFALGVSLSVFAFVFELVIGIVKKQLK